VNGRAADTFRLGRRPALDGLRGIAVLLVLLFHFRVPAAKGGFVGVDVFFVLSGFLITTLLCEEWDRDGRVHFWGFYRRRALRLLPALIALLIVLLTAALVFRRPDRTEVLKHCAAALFYAFNWLAAYHVFPQGSDLAHTWSLSIEEQFYLVWPLVVVAALRRAPSKVAALALAVAGAVSSAAARGIHWALYHDWERVYFGFDTHADGLLAGCALGLASNMNRLPRGPVARAWLGGLAWVGCAYVLYLTAFPLPSAAHLTLGLPLLNGSVCIILAALLTDAPGGLKPLLEWRPLAWLGRISYGTYLWHWPLWGLMIHYGWNVGPQGVPLALALSVGVAAVSYYGLERFFLGLKQPRLAVTHA